MALGAEKDHLALIRIEGMHCHKCERTIQKALAGNPGVHEVEVDFNSGQASVLFDQAMVTIRELLDSVTSVGYRILGCTERESTLAVNRHPHCRQTIRMFELSADAVGDRYRTEVSCGRFVTNRRSPLNARQGLLRRASRPRHYRFFPTTCLVRPGRPCRSEGLRIGD